ncbi:hypothetical protein DCAR_0414696 [Daucus carota subsp. sativus]|uniref:Glycine-rich protein n=1 Tax=Daucus carota subsp. sativus TaxID=79200 RepID=A0A162A5Y1_DAUCS|nr:hypothetical protein DCAR_0414696 [Daucus carota subsp. sativus]
MKTFSVVYCCLIFVIVNGVLLGGPGGGAGGCVGNPGGLGGYYGGMPGWGGPGGYGSPAHRPVEGVEDMEVVLVLVKAEVVHIQCQILMIQGAEIFKWLRFLLDTI